MASIEKGLFATPLLWSGETSNILINGKGAGVASGIPCNASLAVIDVEPGKTYRLRFICGTALTFSLFGIEGHDVLTVTEADAYSSLLLSMLPVIWTKPRPDCIPNLWMSASCR
jgi:hypothetical protein